MDLLRVVIEEVEEPSEDRVPDGTEVSCDECGWSGAVEECPTETEDEGWEYPSYLMLVCPECGGGIDV